MAIVPTRTSADVNASADINELSGEALDKGGVSQVAALTAETSPAATDLFLMERISDGALRKVTSANLPGGGGEADPEFRPGQFDYPTTNPAPLEPINTGSITNVRLLGQAFDDSTDESVEGEFVVPSDIDTGGNVTFSWIGIAAIAAAAKNVGFIFSHSATNSAEDADVAYSNEASGAQGVNTTQDYNTYSSWSRAVSTLAWTTGEIIKFRLTRDTTIASDLTGDFYIRHFEINIPRA